MVGACLTFFLSRGQIQYVDISKTAKVADNRQKYLPLRPANLYAYKQISVQTWSPFTPGFNM